MKTLRGCIIASILSVCMATPALSDELVDGYYYIWNASYKSYQEGVAYTGYMNSVFDVDYINDADFFHEAGFYKNPEYIFWLHRISTGVYVMYNLASHDGIDYYNRPYNFFHTGTQSTYLYFEEGARSQYRFSLDSSLREFVQIGSSRYDLIYENSHPYWIFQSVADGVISDLDLSYMEKYIFPMYAEREGDVKDGSYFLFNEGAGQFLSAGSDWGTRATLDDVGLEFSVYQNGETYSIKTPITQPSRPAYSFLYYDVKDAESQVFCDQTEGGWTFELRENGKVLMRLHDTDEYLKYDENTGNLIRTTLSDANDVNAHWRLMTKAERMQAVSTGTYSKPQDASFLIQCPDFGRFNTKVSAWSGTFQTGGDMTNYVAYVNNSAFDVSQELTGLPKGWYEVSCQGFYRGGDAGSASSDKNAILYANDKKVPLMGITEGAKAPSTLSEVSLLFAEGQSYSNNRLRIEVTDGTLHIGVRKSEEKTSDWTVFDRFRLSYIGHQNPDDLDLLKAELNEAVEQLGELKETITAYTVLASEVQKVQSKYSDAAYDTVEEYEQAIADVQAFNGRIAEISSYFNAMQDAFANEEAMPYDDASPIVRYALKKTLEWMASDTATYAAVDEHMLLMQAYVKDYAPIYNEAAEVVAAGPEKMVETLSRLLSRQTRQLTRGALVDMPTLQQLQVALKTEIQNVMDFISRTFTASTIEGVEVTYYITDAEARTCEVVGVPDEVAGKVTIPAEARGYMVKTIGERVFESRHALTAVTLPESVDSIAQGAFTDCTNLVDVDIQGKRVHFAHCAGTYEPLYGVFQGCTALKRLELPTGDEIMANGLLSGCTALEELVIPEGYKGAREWSFGSRTSDNGAYTTNLQKLTLPDSWERLSAIPASAMMSVYSLDVYVTAIAGYDEWYNFWMQPGNRSINDLYLRVPNIQYVCENGILGGIYGNPLTDAEVHLMADGVEVTEIDVPEGTTMLPEGAFEYLNRVEHVTLPSSLTEMGACAFLHCWSLTEAKVPGGVKTIPQGAFSRSGVQTVTLEEGVESLAQWAFDNCSRLKEVNLPKSLTTIEGNAFENDSQLTSITLPEGLQTIDYKAFEGCLGLTDVYCLATTPPYCNAGAFADETYANATLYVPSGAGEAYRSAFGWCRFEHIVEMNETAVKSILPEVQDNLSWYTLGGQKLNGRPAQPGVYIHDGQKVTIR